MHDSTFSGIDINSLTSLSQLIIDLSKNRNLIPGLTWIVQYPNPNNRVEVAEKDGAVVWHEVTDIEERSSTIQITNDQGKTFVVEFGSGIKNIYSANEDDFTFENTVHKINFGVASQFPEFFKARFSQLEEAVRKLSGGVEFYFTVNHETLYLVLNRPLATNSDESISIRRFREKAVEEACKIVKEFEVNHFMGNPSNKWELYIYTSSEESAKNYFEGLDPEKILYSVVAPSKDYSIKVTRKGNVIHFTLFQHIDSSAADYPGILRKIHESYFKKEIAKIFDKNDTIKTIEL